MTQLNIDAASADVQEFVRNLARQTESFELILHGQIVCKVLPAKSLSTDHVQALVAERWALIRRAREHNQNIPRQVLEREIRDAVQEVRGRAE